MQGASINDIISMTTHLRKCPGGW